MNRLNRYLLLFLISGNSVLSQDIADRLVLSGTSPVYSLSIMDNSIFVSNKHNYLHKEKLSYDIEQVNSGGFDVKQAKINLTDALTKSLTATQKSQLSTINIGLTLLVRKNGKIDEVRFQLPKDNKLTFGTLESIEKILLKTKYPIKNEALNAPINYMAFFFPLRGAELTK